MKILLFGITKEIIGSSTIDFTIDQTDLTSEMLLDILKEKYPELSKLRSIALAVNGEHANGSEIVSDKDEIALIPPMSGG
ncbi:MoaD/ThiS family protein [Flammeovirga aprica]|uniref:Molybdopterin synthase sulfur carrier subunit n=1 Tax=Flammeovirga aprica JL-4 TaxID=694437 RepID=A0A7X9RVP3_9BACT|nr:MoaD/ThiS family protein [Flammeovirga aprica]NME69556.1 MoaD/ThiS family protein [Flammeovirga aprica JL-4]